MRYFPFITIGKILKDCEKEGIKISRPTFMKLMQKDLLFQMTKTAGGWYTASKAEEPVIIELIKKNYKINGESKSPAQNLKSAIGKIFTGQSN